MSFGYNFRSSLSYVTDPVGTAPVYIMDPDFTYPRNFTIEGTTYVAGLLAGAEDYRDRSATVDPRLAGIAQIPNSQTAWNTRFDLPTTGTYNLRAAFGDALYSQNHYVEIYDDTTLVQTLATGTATGAGEFIDASGVIRTSAADWVSNNQPLEVAFTTTICRVVIGGGGTGTGNSTVAHINFEEVSGPTLTTTLVADASDTALPTSISTNVRVFDNTNALVGTGTITVPTTGEVSITDSDLTLESGMSLQASTTYRVDFQEDAGPRQRTVEITT